MSDIERIGNGAPQAWPAVLTATLAAVYCGLSQETFLQVCPVKPLRFPIRVREDRYLRMRLDAWLLSLDESERFDRGAKPSNAPKAPSHQPSAFNPRQIAERWDCSERHVRNMIKRGDLPAFKFGGKLLRVKLEDIERLERGGRDDGEGTTEAE